MYSKNAVILSFVIIIIFFKLIIFASVWAVGALRKADVWWEKRKQKYQSSGSGTALNDTLSETEDGGWIVQRKKKKKQD